VYSLLQFVVPERLSGLVVEKVIPIAGGATVLPAWGYWHNGSVVESEPVSFVVVGVDSRFGSWLVRAVLDTLREAGEQAAWYIRDGVPQLVRFEEGDR
jgi:hypothetical protein